MEGMVMLKNRKIVRSILLVVLLICTALIMYSLITDPFGEGNILFRLAVALGFIALGADKKKSERKNKVGSCHTIFRGKK